MKQLTLAIVCLWVWAPLAQLSAIPLSFFLSGSPPASGSSWLLSETFEGTGYSGTAWTETGTVDEDYTTTVLSGSQSASAATGGTNSGYVAFTGQTTVYAYCLLRRRTQSAVANNTVFRLTNSSNTTLAALAVNFASPNTQFKLYANATFGTASATVQGAANTTTYHVWLKYVSGGTCELAMSTTGTKPTGTGTGLVYLTGTGASDTATRVMANLGNTDGNWIIDNVIVSTTAIGDNPTP